MQASIKITNMIVNSLSNNANINFGPSLQNSHTANTKQIGGNFAFGDHSVIFAKTFNHGTMTEPAQQDD